MKIVRSVLPWTLVLANAAFLGALSTHVVHGPNGWGVVAKDHMTLVNTYMDTRAWQPSDLANHPAFVQRVEEADKANLLPTATPTPVTQGPVAPVAPVAHVTVPAARPQPAPAPAPAPVAQEKEENTPHQHSIFDVGQ